jgi:hypothetical protein
MEKIRVNMQALTKIGDGISENIITTIYRQIQPWCLWMDQIGHLRQQDVCYRGDSKDDLEEIVCVHIVLNPVYTCICE